MIILTDDQAAKVKDSLKLAERTSYSETNQDRFIEALAVLDGAQRVEQIGIAAVAPNQGVTIGWYPNVLVTHNDKIYGVKETK